MTTIFNQKAEGIEKESHMNFMGGTSFDISNPIKKLRMVASSCFFGEPMYYHRDKNDKRPVHHNLTSRLSDTDVTYLVETLDGFNPSEWRGLSPAELLEKVIDEALDFNGEETLKEAVRLRNEEDIRTTPQVILVRAANNKKLKGSGLIRKYAKQIMLRPDEPAVCLAYQLYRFKRPIPNSLKRAMSDKLHSLSEFQLAKYRLESRSVKTVDVVNLTHPMATAALYKLVKKKLSLEDSTWESLISRLGSTTNSWTSAVSLMGHMALLRNLSNLIDNKVDKGLYKDKLIEGAKTGKQLPFRYVSAYNQIKDKASPDLLDAVEQCLMNSIENLPRFSGKVMSLCDNSGSAQGATTSSMGSMSVSTIGNLTGILTGMCADEGYLGIFGDALEVLPVRKNSSIFDVLEKATTKASTIGGGTENGIWLFFDKAIKEKEHWDTIFVYSDMQAGHGGLYGTNARDYSEFSWKGGKYIDVAKLINKYRREVNPNVNIFLVQTAGQQDTIVPEFYNRTYILGGWGEGLLKFAASMIKQNQQ